MTDKQKLEAQIEQNQTERELLIKEGQRLHAELEEVTKPDLRHGDYGTGRSGDNAPYFRLNAGNNIYNEHGVKNPSGRAAQKDVWLGNIFADLKMLSEPLEKFEVSGQYDNNNSKTLKAYIGTAECTTDKIHLYLNTNSSYFTIDQAEEISNNLRRLIATAGMRNK